MKKIDDSKLCLDEIESTLRGVLNRLKAIRAESDALKAARPTRDEVQSAMDAWLNRHLAAGKDKLFSRLANQDFLIGQSGNVGPGILFSGSGAAWSDSDCHPAGLLLLLSEPIKAYLNQWIESLPDESLGTLTAQEKSVKLAELESERLSIITRRSTLQQRLRQATSGGDPPAELLSRQFAGGVLLHSNPAELLDKAVSRI